MTEMQKQFEEWCSNKPLKTDKNEVGLYKYVSTDYAWQAWQASRAAIVVKLGSAQNTSFEEWQVYHEDEIKDELKRLGVSYE